MQKVLICGGFGVDSLRGLLCWFCCERFLVCRFRSRIRFYVLKEAFFGTAKGFQILVVGFE